MIKDTQIEAVVAPLGITVEEGGGRKFVTLASLESRLPSSKILATPSAVFNCPKSDVYERWALLPAPPEDNYAALGCMRCSRLVFLPLLCDLMPAAPLS
jgi:hypothetical protein